MLFILGKVVIDSPAGLNAQESDEDFGHDFALKPVVGAQQPREDVGVGDHTRSITGTIYPYFQDRTGLSNGLQELADLKAMTDSGLPQLLVNGLGQNLGWWFILKVSRKDSNLGAPGIGRAISYQIGLAESPTAAPAASIVDTITSLLV